MNTPTRRDFLRRPDATRRRSARQALAVIPVNNSSSPGETISTEVNAMDNFLNSRHGSDSWSPAPSPDELVIQKRGRRRKTIVWSPDLDMCKRNSLFNSRDRTPVKSPSKTTTMLLRSTPRKRLSLGNPNESEFTTPEKKKKSQLLTATSNSQSQFSGSLASGLRGLSREQLVDMIMDVVAAQEETGLPEGEKLHNILLKKMPTADVQPLIDNLNNLKQNIHLSLLLSKLDDSSNNYARIHLDVFQKAIIDQGKRLVESQHWTSVIQYVHGAWNITKQISKCENQNVCDLAHKCFKYLTHFCHQALKRGTFTGPALDMFADRLDTMLADCEDIKICLQLISEAKNNET